MDASTAKIPLDSGFGRWSHDDSGIPCFDLAPSMSVEPDAPLLHIMSTTRMSAFVDRWGALTLSTTDGGHGYRELLPNRWRCRSLLTPAIELDDGLHSLLPGEATLRSRARYGIGYAEFEGEHDLGGGRRIGVSVRIVAPWQSGGLVFAAVQFTNRGTVPMTGRCSLRSDLAPWNDEEDEAHSAARIVLGDGHALITGAWPGRAALIGERGLIAQRRFHSLWLETPGTWAVGETWSMRAWIGMVDGDPETPQACLQNFDPTAERSAWAERLAPVAPPWASAWEADECRWSMGQLLSFAAHDGALDETYIALVGYSWSGFPVRECAETAMILAPWFPHLARSSLRWLAKLQWSTGDVPKCHDCRPPVQQPASAPHDSDTELWFIIGALEAVGDGLEPAALEEILPWADGGSATLWEHLRRAWQWVVERIGVGEHGVPRIWFGDWNDYLSAMGREGRGESQMNAGMACRAAALLAKQARLRHEPALAQAFDADVQRLRAGAFSAWSNTHFARGWTDGGAEVGGRDGRVFINAQSWPALGKVGFALHRQTALRTALAACHSPIGLLLCSRPFSCPPPAEISWCPIPAGEGENAGIWPQTVHWMVWALAEAGMREEALDVWRRMSLRHHARLHPTVPYGIFNGPDCYSSHHAPGREGRTQRALIDRASFVPMNPAVAWQAFSLRRIGPPKE